MFSSTGLQDSSDATIETLKAIEHPISKTAQILVEACSFAGTGNVLKVQAMLHYCDEHIGVAKEKDGKEENKEESKDAKEEVKPDDTFQAFAVLGVALVAMGEDIGAEMTLRQFNHLVSILYHLESLCVLPNSSHFRCTTVNLSFVKLSLSPSVLLASQIHNSPFSTRCRNTVTTMTCKSLSTPYSPWVSSVLVPTMLDLLKCCDN